MLVAGTRCPRGSVPPGALSRNNGGDKDCFQQKAFVADFDRPISTELAMIKD
jgi:hypothetical protein